MQLDHVTLAVSDLSILTDLFASHALTTRYGGAHSNGVTHMSILGLADGSYVELISKVDTGRRAPSWNNHIDRDAGPCAWAVSVPSIRTEVERLTRAGLTVKPPRELKRQRPDGVVVEWALATVGEHEPGAVHPFLIQDHMPREYRVPVSSFGSTLGLMGVRAVVIAVEDVTAAVGEFRSAWGFARPLSISCDGFPTDLTLFPDNPVALVPAAAATWLAERVKSFGDGPCAFLLACNQWEHLMEVASLDRPGLFGSRSLAWLPATQTLDPRLGFVDVSQ